MNEPNPLNPEPEKVAAIAGMIPELRRLVSHLFVIGEPKMAQTALSAQSALDAAHEEITRLTAQVTELQAANTREVERRREAEAKVTKWQEIALDLFRQACGAGGGRYEHSCISAYEDAQCSLIDAELLAVGACLRACCDEHRTKGGAK